VQTITMMLLMLSDTGGWSATRWRRR